MMFPEQEKHIKKSYQDTEQKTLRDEFAMACLAIIADFGEEPELIASHAYLIADAMMKEREKR